MHLWIILKNICPRVLKALEDEKLGDKNMVLMALATIRAETARFLPIDEGKSKYNTSPGCHPFDLYNNRADLGNKGNGDGDKFKGRGCIQLTGRSNYTKFSKTLGKGTELVKNPELANDPVIAARILALYIKDKERNDITLAGSYHYNVFRLPILWTMLVGSTIYSIY